MGESRRSCDDDGSGYGVQHGGRGWVGVGISGVAVTNEKRHIGDEQVGAEGRGHGL